MNQRFLGSDIALDIGCSFIAPEFSTRFWGDLTPSTFVTMPETAVNKNHGSVFWHHNIRFTGKILPVKTEAQSHRMKKGSNTHFWLRISLANCSHIAASLFDSVNVSHVIFRLTSSTKAATVSGLTGLSSG